MPSRSEASSADECSLEDIGHFIQSGRVPANCTNVMRAVRKGLDVYFQNVPDTPVARAEVDGQLCARAEEALLCYERGESSIGKTFAVMNAAIQNGSFQTKALSARLVEAALRRSDREKLGALELQSAAFA